VVLIPGVVAVDVAQQLDLVQALVKVVLVVLDDLEADQRARGHVQRLDRLGEGGAAQEVHHLAVVRAWGVGVCLWGSGVCPWWG